MIDKHEPSEFAKSISTESYVVNGNMTSGRSGKTGTFPGFMRAFAIADRHAISIIQVRLNSVRLFVSL